MSLNVHAPLPSLASLANWNCRKIAQIAKVAAT